jgi:hypothetical protein
MHKRTRCIRSSIFSKCACHGLRQNVPVVTSESRCKYPSKTVQSGNYSAVDRSRPTLTRPLAIAHAPDCRLKNLVCEATTRNKPLATLWFYPSMHDAIAFVVMVFWRAQPSSSCLETTKTKKVDGNQSATFDPIYHNHQQQPECHMDITDRVGSHYAAIQFWRHLVNTRRSESEPTEV